MAETLESLRKSGERENGGCPLVSASVATLGHVRGRDPMDTSSAEQDEEDSGRDEAGKAGGSRPVPIDLQLDRKKPPSRRRERRSMFNE